jgi:hypothetical protein
MISKKWPKTSMFGTGKTSSGKQPVAGKCKIPQRYKKIVNQRISENIGRIGKDLC